MSIRAASVALVALLFCHVAPAEEGPSALRVGRAGHAFDHVGGLNEQAATAAASGATIIYATGLGGVGYAGLPPKAELQRLRQATAEYNRDAKSLGIELSIGYVCATSIVGLESFDKNWPDELRQAMRSGPAEWRQRDRQGSALPSWYGGAYQPACMNHPDWREYEKFVVRQQLETGHDGIFFDNPTVHPQGCYCEHCMKRFAAYLQGNEETAAIVGNSPADTAKLRELAATHARLFMAFRATIAREFLAEMRRFARTINPHALVTCNNSLNSPERLYAQSRVYGYNIHELSRVQDYVVVEDMASLPRKEADGRVFEYGPTYRQLHAISRGKPVVAVTLANADYHTAPNLVRLAMAEAAAHEASYLSWPTWPEEQRERKVRIIRPQADLLREHADLLNDAAARADVVLFLPWRRWLGTERCAASEIAAALTKANIQYRVVAEEGLAQALDGKNGRPALLIERDVITDEQIRVVRVVDQHGRAGGRILTTDQGTWPTELKELLEKPSVTVAGPPTVRAVVRDQPGRTIVHVYNLDIERLSSFEDRVTPAAEVALTVRVPASAVGGIQLLTADEKIEPPRVISKIPDGADLLLEIVLPRVSISVILVIEHA